MILRARQRVIPFPRRPLIMGILNLNADSFSDSGAPVLEDALALADRMIADGADLIDAGAESARTNRGPISEDEETARFLPFIEAFQARLAEGRLPPPRDEAQVYPPLLSLNTWRPVVAEAILAAGGDVLNDMGGLPTAENARIAARHGVALLIMHLEGQVKVRHAGIQTGDIITTLQEFFTEKLALATGEGGLPPDRIILDPGIGFAKRPEHDLDILRRLPELAALGRPLLLPVSRKEVIGAVLNQPDPRARDAGTVAASTLQNSRHELRPYRARLHPGRVPDRGDAARAGARVLCRGSAGGLPARVDRRGRPGSRHGAGPAPRRAGRGDRRGGGQRGDDRDRPIPAEPSSRAGNLEPRGSPGLARAALRLRRRRGPVLPRLLRPRRA
jgi:dihydropteroate synthase